MQFWSLIECFYSFKVSTHNIPINYKGKIVTGENQQTLLSQSCKTSIINIETSWCCVSPGMLCWKERNITTLVFLPKMLNLKSYHEQTKKNSKWGGRAFCKTISLYSSKILLTKKKKRKTEALFHIKGNWRDNWLQCVIWDFLVL